MSALNVLPDITYPDTEAVATSLKTSEVDKVLGLYTGPTCAAILQEVSLAEVHCLVHSMLNSGECCPWVVGLTGVRFKTPVVTR